MLESSDDCKDTEDASKLETSTGSEKVNTSVSVSRSSVKQRNIGEVTSAVKSPG